MKDISTIDNTPPQEPDDPDQRRSTPWAGLWQRLRAGFTKSSPPPLSGRVEVMQQQGQQTQTHHAMVENVARLHEARVDDVMIARSEIEALDIDTSLEEALLVFERSGHSRLPVYAETLDDPRGMVHIRDLLSFITQTARDKDTGNEEATTQLDFSKVNLHLTLGEIDIIREVLFVPASMRASQLLSRMQTTRTQMALVIDEYGGTDGLASMEDVFELVVGDIEDEHDDDEIMMVAEAHGCWLVDARAELEEIATLIGQNMYWGELADDVDTIGGLIVSLLDHIPARGETVEIDACSFEVVEADHRRIQRVRIKKL